MTTEDKVKVLAERIVRSHNLSQNREPELFAAYVTQLLPMLTEFALDQQRVGAAAMRTDAERAIDASRDKVGRLMHECWTKTKRSQGFHHPDEMGHTGRNCCEKCHVDLVDWDALPQKQKDINCNAFDDVLPVLKAAIHALEPIPAPGKGEGTR